MKISKIRRFLCHMIIEGQKREWFFSKTHKFELHVYYTPVKKNIVEFKIYSELKIKDLKLDFGIGDNIDKAKKWTESNKFYISLENNKLN